MSTMPSKPATITDVLRREIADSELSFMALEEQTGLKRQSMMKFSRGEQSLRLDMADRLASFFGLELKPVGGKKLRM